MGDMGIVVVGAVGVATKVDMGEVGMGGVVEVVSEGVVGGVGFSSDGRVCAAFKHTIAISGYYRLFALSVALGENSDRFYELK